MLYVLEPGIPLILTHRPSAQLCRVWSVGRSGDRERGVIVAEDGTDPQESLDPISAMGELRVEELHIRVEMANHWRAATSRRHCP